MSDVLINSRGIQISFPDLALHSPRFILPPRAPDRTWNTPRKIDGSGIDCVDRHTFFRSLVMVELYSESLDMKVARARVIGTGTDYTNFAEVKFRRTGSF